MSVAEIAVVIEHNILQLIRDIKKSGIIRIDKVVMVEAAAEVRKETTKEEVEVEAKNSRNAGFFLNKALTQLNFKY
jgi:hypothetical protein